jgi:type VI secretion system ImpA/VasJ family protein
MPSFDESKFIDLGKNPIPGDAPCGIDAAEDEQYIESMADYAKVDRIEADEPDWFVIEQQCVNILSTKSKDVEIAVALGHALFKRGGYAGLAAALGLLLEMVNNFWDDLYPERPRRRKARIETLTDRFSEGGWFRENQPKSSDFDALDLCVERIGALDEAIKGKMPDDPGEFRKFTSGLKEHAAKRPKQAAPPPPQPDQGAGAPAGADTGASAPSAGGASFAAGEIADTGGAIKAINQACLFLRSADPSDPVSYAVPRIIRWSKVSMPASPEARTQIPPPEGNVVDALQHQFANQMWDNLLKSAEGAFKSSDPLWLDLQRYTCAALGGMGHNFEKARQAVMSATAGLIARLGDGLYELQFRNGTPLCSGETKMWIEAEVNVGSNDGGGGGGGSASNGRLKEASDQARKLAGAGKIKEAIQQLNEGLVTCSQRRDRFLWRVRIGQLLFDAKRFQLAAPLLEECFDEVRRFHLDEWEPSLAVELAQALYRCRKSLTMGEKDPPGESLEKVRESFAWLCRLDPLAAFAAEPTGK